MCDTIAPVDDRRFTIDHDGMEDEDRMRWAEALAAERLRGPDGPRWIADRIGALASARGLAGVERFREISQRYEQLIAGLQDSVTIRS